MFNIDFRVSKIILIDQLKIKNTIEYQHPDTNLELGNILLSGMVSTNTLLNVQRIDAFHLSESRGIISQMYLKSLCRIMAPGD